MPASLDAVFAALADPTRRAILSMLLEDDMAVTDVAEGFDISLAAISKHLVALDRAGLITRERRGRVVWCKLEPDALRDASVWMQGFGQFDGPDLDALEALLTPTLPAHDLLDQLLAAEHGVWDALVTGDAEADRAALHPDFLGLYPDGYADRTAHAAQLADGPTVRHYTLTQARAQSPADGLGLITYRAEFTRTDGNTDAMWITSLWRATPEGWTNLFSQDTPAA